MLSSIIIKSMSTCFPDSAFPRDRIHVFQSGEFVLNPFRIHSYALAQSHHSDVFIPAVDYVSAYSLYRQTPVLRFTPEHNIIITSYNQLPYSYDYLINAMPGEQTFYDIPGKMG